MPLHVTEAEHCGYVELYQPSLSDLCVRVHTKDSNQRGTAAC